MQCVYESGCRVSATGGHVWPGMHGARSGETDKTHKQCDRPSWPPADPCQPREDERGNEECDNEERATERP